MSEQCEFYHYLPVDDDAMQWGLYLTGAGRGRTMAGQSYPPARHPSLYQFDWKRGRTLPEFQIILITDGRGVFESQRTGRTPIEPNTLILLFPGIWHRYRPDPATGWRERWVSLNGELLHRLADRRVIGSAGAVCPLSNVSQIVMRFDYLLDRIHRRPTDNSIVLSLRVMDLIAEVIDQTGETRSLSVRQSSQEKDGVADALVARALDLIWTQSHRPLSVTQIVGRLPATRRTLERRFARERGHSILEEINLCRAGRAKRLLAETDLPIKTVAYLAGFTSQERMRVTFLSKEGCSPVQYRRRCTR
jgi:AraC-like DNA-binding protein